MVIIDKRKVATEWDGGWFCERCYNLQHWKKKANINQKNEKICDKCLDKLNGMRYNKYVIKREESEEEE